MIMLKFNPLLLNTVIWKDYPVYMPESEKNGKMSFIVVNNLEL